MLEADLGALDAACSRFRPDSELSRLSGAGRPVVVGPVLAGAAAVLTDCDVNPTVGLALAARLVAADGTVITTGGWPKEDLS
jgi:thiamine biosynthesis lipoprotein